MDDDHELSTSPADTGETEITPPPVAKPEGDDIRDIVNNLATKVDELSTKVLEMTTVEHDSKPTNRPWTHWGRGR